MTAVESHREHGTYVKYVIDRCRCDDCREAKRCYDHARSRRVEPAYVGADRARQHLNYLAEQCVGLNSVTQLTGLPHGTLSRLVYGDYRRRTRPSKRIRRNTEQAILAINPADAPGGTREPAGPTWTIVEALLEAGWRKAEIGRRITGPDARTLQLGREYVTRKNARIIRDLLDEPVPPRRSRHDLHPVVAPATPPEADDNPVETVEAVEADRYGLPTLNLPDGLDVTWREQATCRRPDIPNYLFFPTRGDKVTLQAARDICARCPVHQECLNFAVELNIYHGIWGGLSEKQRRKARRLDVIDGHDAT